MRVALLFVLALAACANDTITRAEWQQMPQDDRLLYVRSLIGEEQAKAAKGGQPVRHDRSAEEYVKAIDEAYARGEPRDAREIFATLAK